MPDAILQDLQAAAGNKHIVQPKNDNTEALTLAFLITMDNFVCSHFGKEHAVCESYRLRRFIVSAGSQTETNTKSIFSHRE